LINNLGHHDARLTIKRRFNTHVSALFFDNMALREQYISILLQPLGSFTNSCRRMLGDIRDLVQQYGNDDVPPVDESSPDPVFQSGKTDQSILEMNRL
jgi:hypothetical protein